MFELLFFSSMACPDADALIFKIQKQEHQQYYHGDIISGRTIFRLNLGYNFRPFNIVFISSEIVFRTKY